MERGLVWTETRRANYKRLASLATDDVAALWTNEGFSRRTSSAVPSLSGSVWRTVSGGRVEGSGTRVVVGLDGRWALG